MGITNMFKRCVDVVISVITLSPISPLKKNVASKMRNIYSNLLNCANFHGNKVYNRVCTIQKSLKVNIGYDHRCSSSQPELAKAAFMSIQVVFRNSCVYSVFGMSC